MTHREIAMKEFVIEDNGTTPLFLASSRGHLEVVEHLLEARADKDGRFIGGFLVWVELFVFSQLHIAPGYYRGLGPKHFPYEGLVHRL